MYGFYQTHWINLQSLLNILDKAEFIKHIG